MRLMPKQSEAVALCVPLLSEQRNTRQILNMATGTGKTATAAAIVGALAAERKAGLWTVDRINLVNQAVREIRSHQPQLHLSVEMGRIRSGGLKLHDLVVGTIQSVSSRLDQIPKPDYIIVDEAHQDIGNKNYYRMYDYFSDVPRIGLTATAFSGDGVDILEFGKWEGYALQYPLLDAIADGALCNIRAHVTHVDNINISNIDYNKAELSKKDLQKIEDQILQEEVLHKMALAIIEMPTPAIVFCPSTKVSRILSEVINKYDPDSTMHIDCYMDEHEDGSALEEFRNGKRKRVCNYRLWTYGVDVPNCRSVIFCCDKNRVAYMQGIGRVSRWCCKDMLFSAGLSCSCGQWKTEGNVLDFADNVSSHSQSSIWSALAPAATPQQWEEMEQAHNRNPSQSIAEIVSEILSKPIIDKAQAESIAIEEVDIGNPIANLVDRSRLIGLAIPGKLEHEKNCTKRQADLIREAFFYAHETKLSNSSWILDLGKAQADIVLDQIEKRRHAGLADPKLLLQLSRVRRGELKAFDRTVLQGMTQEAAQRHWDRHRQWLKGKK